MGLVRIWWRGEGGEEEEEEVDANGDGIGWYG